MKKRMYLIFPFTIILILSSIFYVYANSIPAPIEEKFVYLTFDDGPTPKITEEILDVLKQQDVKATFFIVGKEIKGREAILKRIYEEGHGIGLHTYSHNLKQIYQNEDIFINEMEQNLNAINEALGTSLDICT